MNDAEKSWYHCGRCGALFLSPPGPADDRVCTKCGRDPSIGLDPGPTVSESLANARADAAQSAAPSPPQVHHHPHAHHHRPSANRTVTKLILGWITAMVLLVIAVKFLAPEEEKPTTESNWKETSVRGTAADESVVNLEKALAQCRQTLAGFLDAATPEERNQFVLNPVGTAGRMARFYNLNPVNRIDPRILKNTGNSLLKLPSGTAVESRWEGPDATLIDCIFREENGEWHLDWDHFIRHQEYPWAPFLAGEGPDECTFRLLARRRLTRDGSEPTNLDLVFYPPRFGRPQSLTSPTIEISVDRDSPSGRLLTAGFKQRESRKPLFDSKLPDLDPEGHLRVRVKIRRIPSPSGDEIDKAYELLEVLACHWLAIDDPGVTPTAPKSPPANPQAPAPAPTTPAPANSPDPAPSTTPDPGN